MEGVLYFCPVTEVVNNYLVILDLCRNNTILHEKYYVVVLTLYTYCLLQELETALHTAASQGHPEVVDLLLKRGAVIDPESDV